MRRFWVVRGRGKVRRGIETFEHGTGFQRHVRADAFEKPVGAGRQNLDIADILPNRIAPITLLEMFPTRHSIGSSQRGSAFFDRPIEIENQTLGPNGSCERGVRSRSGECGAATDNSSGADTRALCNRMISGGNLFDAMPVDQFVDEAPLCVGDLLFPDRIGQQPLFVSGQYIVGGRSARPIQRGPWRLVTGVQPCGAT